MSRARYHHLIPQTYLRSWCYSSGSVYSFHKDNLSEVIVKNIANNFGLNHYHSIRAGMPCCTNDDLLKIFAPINNYKVIFDGKELTSLAEYNNTYFSFKEWDIYYPNGCRVPRAVKNEIKARIEANKVLDIEELWSKKYESGWNFLLQMIKQRTNSSTNLSIDEFYKGKLMKFIVSLNWRSFISNEQLREAFDLIDAIVDLKNIKIPEEDRNIMTDKTVYDEIKHNYLLKQFGAFLRDEGIIYNMAKGYIKHLGIRFLISSEKAEFITSDNPSFIYLGNDGIHHIMPVNPRILISIRKYSFKEGKYYIEQLGEKEVRKINSIIVDNAQEFVISHTPTIAISKS